jgi:hypothetical protein
MSENQQVKRCSHCKEHKPTDQFHRNRTEPDGIDHMCKECKNAFVRNLYHNPRPPKPTPSEGCKRCTMCDEEKPATTEYFYATKWTKSGLEGRCRECRNARAKIQRRNASIHNSPINGGQKTCIRCHEKKPHEMFSHSKHNKDGRQNWCVQCARNYRTENREAISAQRRSKRRAKWKVSNAHYWREIEKIQTIDVQSLTNSDQREKSQRPDQKQYQNDSPQKEKARQRSAQWYRDNPEKARAQSKAWRQSNPEKVKAIRTAWKRANPDQAVLDSQKRRALLKGISGYFTSADIAHIRYIQQGHCAYCSRVGQKLTIEHIIPITRDGTSNDPWNLCLACSRCNSSKGDKLLEEWTDRWYLQEEN